MEKLKRTKKILLASKKIVDSYGKYVDAKIELSRMLVEMKSELPEEYHSMVDAALIKLMEANNHVIDMANLNVIIADTACK
ncbi:hypothetical protein ACVWU4_000933 [Campylobacter coli]